MRFSLRSKVSIVFSLVAIVAIVGGFSFMWAGASIHTAKATGFSVQLTKLQQRLLDGFASSEIDLQNTNGHIKIHSHTPTSDDGCPQNRGDNVKVNQNCLNISDTNLQGRGQAQNETSIAQDPSSSNHIIASYNDYRRGDGNCYGSFSLDGGQN